MDSEGNIKIKGTLMLEEFIKYNELYAKKRLQKIIPLAFILLLVLFKLVFNEISGWTFIIVVALIGSGVEYLGVLKVILFKAKKNFKNDSLLKYEYHYTINKKGVFCESERGTVQYYWSDVVATYFYRRVFILFVSENKGLVLPERFFADREDVIEFRRIVSENVKRKNNIKPKSI